MLTGQRNLVQLREALEAQVREWTNCSAASGAHHADPRYRDAARDADGGLRGAARGDRAPAQELAELNKQSQELVTTSATSPRTRRLRAFQGEGNRQYLTGCAWAARHVVILVDTSTSMLDRTIVNICGAAT